MTGQEKKKKKKKKEKKKKKKKKKEKKTRELSHRHFEQPEHTKKNSRRIEADARRVEVDWKDKQTKGVEPFYNRANKQREKNCKPAEGSGGRGGGAA